MGLIVLLLLALLLISFGIFFAVRTERQRSAAEHRAKPQDGGVWWATPQAIAEFKDRNPNTIEGISDKDIAFVVDVLAHVEQEHGTNRWTATKSGRELLLIDVVRAAAEMDYLITHSPKLCTNCNEPWPCADMRDLYVHPTEDQPTTPAPGPFGHAPMGPFEHGRDVNDGVEWHDAPSH